MATSAFIDLYPTLTANNLLLEEVEESEGGRFRIITSGYDDKRTLSPHDKMFKPEFFRAYKMFKIDAISGRVIPTKIRSVDSSDARSALAFRL